MGFRCATAGDQLQAGCAGQAHAGRRDSLDGLAAELHATAGWLRLGYRLDRGMERSFVDVRHLQPHPMWHG